MEINHKYNKELAGSLVNAAVGFLLQNEMITKDDLDSVSVKMGYLFSREDGGLEALFGIETADDRFFFALQEGILKGIDITDEMFTETVSVMEQNHPCLLNDDLPETEIQKVRREKNNDLINGMDIITSDRLMTRWEDSEVELKDKESICRRALACFYVIQIACDINNNNYEESLDYFKPILESLGLMDELNEKEESILDGSYEMQDVFDLAWAYEAYWALCWCLGLVDDITHAEEICDCDAAISFAGVSSVEEFASGCELRSKEEILDMLDLYFRYNWAVNDSRAYRRNSAGNLNPSVVIERRRGLEWIVSYEDDWYDLEMNA
ncbi:MAG: DUF4272 domain-containing protein [Clostridiales bacterium]|nr:DUF4272 domain-containing protein [Clostridiales bacterium]